MVRLKFKNITLSVLACSAVLAGYTPQTVHAGGMYIYEMADPAGVGYGSAGQAARANRRPLYSRIRPG